MPVIVIIDFGLKCTYGRKKRTIINAVSIMNFGKARSDCQKTKAISLIEITQSIACSSLNRTSQRPLRSIPVIAKSNRTVIKMVHLLPLNTPNRSIKAVG